MYWIHAHLILNHIPVIGTLACLLLLGAGGWKDNRELLRGGLWGLVLVGGISTLVYLTGLQSAPTVRTLASAEPRAIPPHENLAYYALIWSLVTGGFSALGLWRFGDRPIPSWFLGVLIGAAVLELGLMGWSAFLGVKVNHPEIRGVVQPKFRSKTVQHRGQSDTRPRGELHRTPGDVPGAYEFPFALQTGKRSQNPNDL